MCDNFIVTTTTWIRVNGLAIGHHYGEVDEHHASCDEWSPFIETHTAKGEHQEDFLGGISIRRQRITGEYRQGDLLGQIGLMETITAQCATN